MATHLGAYSAGKGQQYQVKQRPTPKPGPHEILIAVKSIALNPADYLMRDLGLFMPENQTVVGFDLAGLVTEVGHKVPATFEPNVTRVAAYAAFLWKAMSPKYGAFQERLLVPWQHAIILPNDRLSWNEAATLPVSVEVPLNAWDDMGIPRLGNGVPSSTKDEALLIWGASSSVGSMGVQTARLLREDETSAFKAVYATAGAANLDYVTSLGADRVFDYKDADTVEKIIAAAKEDGLLIRHCFLAMGDLASCQNVFKAFGSQDDDKTAEQTAKIASAPPVPEGAAVLQGQETIFIQPPSQEASRLSHFEYWFGEYLQEPLKTGTIKPSPPLTVVGKGLEAINAGLDRLAKGVSCTKLVVEVAE